MPTTDDLALINERIEQRHLSPEAHLWYETRRLYVACAALLFALILTVGMALFFAFKKSNQGPRFIAVDERGNTHLLSTNDSALDPKDALTLRLTERSIREWAIDFYTRDPLTYNRDWYQARQFMTDRFIETERQKYGGDLSRKEKLLALPACSPRVIAYNFPEPDRYASPYRARLRLQKLLAGGAIETWDLDVTFIYYSLAFNGVKGPIWNDAGVFIDKVSEAQELQ